MAEMPLGEGRNINVVAGAVYLADTWKPTGGFDRSECHRCYQATIYFMDRTSNLMRWVVSGRHFVAAYQSVKRNRGSAGVDGVKTEDLPRYMMLHWERIREELLSGDYRPQSVRGVSIPKPNGGSRKLGIPTVIDRLIQQSVSQVISPFFERDFSEYSYGFRPKRNAHQALHQANKYLNQGRTWIIDLDLKSFFDRVHHDKLMSLLCFG